VPRDNRDEDGRYNKHHTDQQYINAVRRHEPAGTRDIANDLNVDVETARLRLTNLATKDKLNQSRAGNTLIFTTP
jgi:predicted ArsR family transcriptional regulator